MSKDSSRTHIHLPSPHLADLFEDFCRPPSSTTTTNPSGTGSHTNPSNLHNPNISAGPNADNPSTSTRLPGSFLPFEDIYLPAHLQPLNPEDEDDVVPQEHAAYGIMRATGRLGGAEGGGVAAGGGSGGVEGQNGRVWRDLGLEGLMGGGGGGGQGRGTTMSTSRQREGAKRIVLLR